MNFVFHNIPECLSEVLHLAFAIFAIRVSHERGNSKNDSIKSAISAADAKNYAAEKILCIHGDVLAAQL